MLNSASKATAPNSKLSQSTFAGGKVLQRKCACGNHKAAGGECTSCAAKKLHKKLSMGATNDPLELEADRVADQVLADQPAHSFSNISTPKIQRRAEQSSEQTEEVPSSVERVLSNPGNPLPQFLRRDMEQRFNQDFSQVRIHTDAQAAQSAHDINANAYTTGNNIVFGNGKFSPESQQGKHLLAHELTHVVQQSNSVATGSKTLPISHTTQKIARDPNTAPKPDPVQEAHDQVATAALAGGAFGLKPDDPVWGKLNRLWMVHLLQVLDAAAKNGQLSVLARYVDNAGGGANVRLRLAIDAVNMKATTKPGQIDSDFLNRLSALKDDRQVQEVIQFVSGTSKMTLVVSPNKPGQPDFLNPVKAPKTSPKASATPSAAIANMSGAAKLVEAISRAKINAAVRQKLLSLITPEALAIAIISFAVVFIASQFTPVGWAADIGLALTGIFIGSALFVAINHLIRFADARNATTSEELDQAGEEFAQAVAEIEVDAIILLVTHGAGGGAKGGGVPYNGPPPTGLVLGVTRGGALVPVAVNTLPVQISMGLGVKGIAATNALMSAGSGPGGGPNRKPDPLKVKEPEIPEDTHGLRNSPGGKPVAEGKEVGNFVHNKSKNYEKLPQLIKGKPNVISDVIPPDAIPEYPVKRQGYSAGREPRIDRLDRAGRTVIEIKPRGLYEEGLAEAKAYALDMDILEPLPNGQKWQAKCVTYDYELVQAFLKSIGYLP